MKLKHDCLMVALETPKTNIPHDPVYRKNTKSRYHRDACMVDVVPTYVSRERGREDKVW